MTRWLPALITYAVIGLALCFHDAKAEECSDFAYLVEALNNAKPHQRPALVEVWRGLTDDNKKIQLITRAFSFVSSGGTEGQAWKQCKTY